MTVGLGVQLQDSPAPAMPAPEGTGDLIIERGNNNARRPEPRRHRHQFTGCLAALRKEREDVNREQKFQTAKSPAAGPQRENLYSCQITVAVLGHIRHREACR